MLNRAHVISLVVSLLLPAAFCTQSAGAAEPRPQLVVVVVVDQLRGDLPARAAAASPNGGFSRILQGGVVYDQAYHEHATTATAPGHATLFTGAYPSEHGIVGNEWYDRDAKRRTTSVRSPEHGEDIGPFNLRATTIGDELALACGSRCRVFGISGKDRGAVLPAGHLGKAFWFDARSGGFRSSAYYGAALPDWVSQWNAAIPKSMYPAQWTLLRKPDEYPDAAADDRPFERPPNKLGRTFPHALGQPGDPGYYDLFLDTPYVDALTLAFARRLVEAEDLGSDSAPDLLSVSLSATDYVGHSFGPESLEAADNLVRLDRELAAFIAFLDARVGRERYLLALSADHGLGATPEYSASRGFAARRIDADALAEMVNRELDARLHVASPVVAFTPPALYLDRAKLLAAGVAVKDAAAAAATVLRSQPGIAYAFTGDNLSGDSQIGRFVGNSVYAPRSGDVYVIPEPESAVVEGLDVYTAYHGTPYTADRYVPLYFFGGGTAAQRIDRTVGTRSLASTLAAILGVPAPSYASAPVLVEVTGAFDPSTVRAARAVGKTRSQASTRGATAR
jgi:hypothetical protein